MDSSGDRHASTQQVRPPTPDEFFSDSGWALLWIDGILLVPAIFGAMFLSLAAKLLVASVGIALAATFGILYSWARVHPTGTTAHLLELLHVAPRRPIAR